MLRYTELQQRIEHAIGELPEEHRRLLSLRNERHFRYDEISRITGLPLGTVKSRVHHALEALRGDPRTRRYFEGEAP